MPTHPTPKIVNVERGDPHLRGLRIMSPGPFGQALVACGVPEEEVEQWTVLSQHPEGGLPSTDKTVVLKPWEISSAMLSRVTNPGDISGRNRDYVNAFESVAPNVILKQIALSVVGETLDLRPGFAHRHPANIKSAVFWGGSLATYAGLSHAAGLELVPAVASSLVTGIAARSVARYTLSEARAAKKILKHLSVTHPQLGEQVSDAILPVFGRID